MAIELSAVAAGLPMAASFAMAGGFVALREGRRRTSLNAAMHELRRPLQALCLSLPAEPGAHPRLVSSLDMAVAAVDLLDREINGESVVVETAPLSVRSIIEPAMDRWRPVAAGLQRPLDLRWSGGEAVLSGDRIVLAQAVDNLISNGLRHGSGGITISVRIETRLLRIAVRDRGCAIRPRGRRLSWQRFAGRGRHGHGLAIVRRTVAQHGGSFRLWIAEAGTEAEMTLPLEGGGG